MDKKIRLSGMLSESLVNGEGLRYVIFAQICKHNCPGCFNPDTHSETGGTWFDLDDVLHTILKNPLIDGVTFSGGDPLEQADKFSYLAKQLKEAGLNIWCYTGYTYESILENLNKKVGLKELISCIDVLVDGRFEQDKKDPNLKFRGSTNQRIIDVPKSLLENKVILLSV